MVLSKKLSGLSRRTHVHMLMQGILFYLLIDQVSKMVALRSLSLGQPQVVASWLNVRLSFNPGIAYGWLSHDGWWSQVVLSLFALCIIAGVIIWWYRKTNSLLITCAVAMLVGGALGNVIDRLRYGYVVDFIDVHHNGWHFATFNFADMAVSGAATLFVLAMLFERRRSDSAVQ